VDGIDAAFQPARVQKSADGLTQLRSEIALLVLRRF
jgi:hypothetical protein